MDESILFNTLFSLLMFIRMENVLFLKTLSHFFPLGKVMIQAAVSEFCFVSVSHQVHLPSSVIQSCLTTKRTSPVGILI